MATFTGTSADEIIRPGFVSATVTRNPGGSFPSASNDSVDGGSGNDSIDGSGGNDTLDGDQGNDTLLGGAGNDLIHYGYGADLLNGGIGNDRFVIFNSPTSGFGGTVVGGSGVDTIDATGEPNIAALSFSGVETLDVDNSVVRITTTQLAQLTTINHVSADPLAFYFFNVSAGGSGDLTGKFADTSKTLIFDGRAFSGFSPGFGVTIGAEYVGSVRVAGSVGGDTVSSGSGNDSLFGGIGSDSFSGNAGNDTLDGDQGNDTLLGGAGNDVISHGFGVDSLNGGTGNDRFVLYSNPSSVFGGTVVGGSGVDTIDATGEPNIAALSFSGVETLDVDNFVVRITTTQLAQFTTINHVSANASAFYYFDVRDGGSGDLTGKFADTSKTLYFDGVADSGSSPGFGVTIGAEYVGSVQVSGSNGGDTVSSGSRNDSLFGDSGNDSFSGNAGNDTLDGDRGDDTLIGGAGNDLLSGGLGSDSFDGGDGSDTLSFAEFSRGGSIALPTGTTDLGESIEAFRAIENVIGSQGDDTIIGSAGANRLSGEGGDDTISGGAGDDTISGGLALDTLDGGTGIDTVDYSFALGGGSINLATGTAFIDGETETITSFENAIGSLGAEVITGTGAANRLEGGSGADTLLGGGGNDTLSGGGGTDSLDGGLGIDTLDYAFATTGGTINLAGSATVGGIAETTTNFENAIGSQGADTILGTAIANALRGSGGNDSLSGGAGNDTLTGDAGADTLAGGTGADVFDFNAVTDSLPGTRDMIAGIEGVGVAGGDRIDLSGIDTNPATAGDQAFAFVGTAAFTGIGQVRVSNAAGGTLVQANLDADAAAEFEILIQDGAILAANYAATDFIL